MDCRFTNGGFEAILDSDIAGGWRRLKNTFGFCEESKTEVSNDEILRVQVAVYAWPNYLGVAMGNCPQDIFGLEKQPQFTFEVRSAKFSLTLPMEGIRASTLPKSGLPGFYQRPICFWKMQSRNAREIGFWVSILVVLNHRVAQIYPDITEWDTQFLSRGRYGSNRRH